ncbi:HDR018Wp [Eremothecium sinecaudum]|uniref:Acireductone dioxygenase n=1 Tax=Eremothecium sinecaudum TaxID=45286 RepID=A0A109UX47_9SACH|nr:HDR018Wp [Eremothecium sinecaudum]AMD20761.1 HDR018Wp [Eremothecium sinecaudum]
MVQAYLHDNDTSQDFRKLHNSGKAVTIEHLEKIGVIYRYCKTEKEVDDLARERNYSNRDVVLIKPDVFPTSASYLDKLKMFYAEHLHEDEEIRYVLEGSGYFDVRDPITNEWIRILLVEHDLIVIPAGLYHRFVVTEANFIKALRLFKDEPKWQALYKPEADNNPILKDYLSSINV